MFTRGHDRQLATQIDSRATDYWLSQLLTKAVTRREQRNPHTSYTALHLYLGICWAFKHGTMIHSPSVIGAHVSFYYMFMLLCGLRIDLSLLFVVVARPRTTGAKQIVFHFKQYSAALVVSKDPCLCPIVIASLISLLQLEFFIRSRCCFYDHHPTRHCLLFL